MINRLAGLNALITGGTQGIGLATALRLAAAGAEVTICGSRGESVDAASRAASDAGLAIKALVADVRDLEAVAAFVDASAGSDGIDILVNSAGIQRYGTVEETSEALWAEVQETNVTSMFRVSRLVIPHMRRRGGGSIVNVSSVQAFAAQQGAAAYVTSKGAINALSKAMALDHARDGIRVNVVCPGSVDTPMLRAAALLFSHGRDAEDVIGEWGEMHPMGRVGRPEEVAEVIAFLADPRASFVTGAEITVDGGLLATLPVRLPQVERREGFARTYPESSGS